MNISGPAAVAKPEMLFYAPGDLTVTKNQLYDTDDNYIIYGVSNYLKGNLQLSYLKEGESILVISNGKVLLSDPYQFDKIYSIQLLQ